MFNLKKLFSRKTRVDLKESQRPREGYVLVSEAKLLETVQDLYNEAYEEGQEGDHRRAPVAIIADSDTDSMEFEY